MWWVSCDVDGQHRWVYISYQNKPIHTYKCCCCFIIYACENKITIKIQWSSTTMSTLNLNNYNKIITACHCWHSHKWGRSVCVCVCVADRLECCFYQILLSALKSTDLLIGLFVVSFLLRFFIFFHLLFKSVISMYINRQKFQWPFDIGQK